MRKLLEFIPHLTLVMALGLALFAILDGYNPFMEWLTSGVSKVYIYLFCALSAGTALLCILGRDDR